MRKQLLMSGLVGCLLLTALSLAPALQGQDDLSEREIRRGFEINPVALNLRGKDIGAVGRGSYLVNGPADCVGCHTVGLHKTGGDPFLGLPTVINTANFLAGGEPFGPFISRNLTPDKSGRPAGLSYEEFVMTIRTGTDLKGLPPDVPSAPGLLQVMPWPQHRYATDRDLAAIYQYLSAIPCKEGGPGQLPNRC